MKNFKKYSIFLLLLLLLSACGKQKISLPKSKDLDYINVTEVDNKKWKRSNKNRKRRRCKKFYRLSIIRYKD